MKIVLLLLLRIIHAEQFKCCKRRDWGNKRREKKNAVKRENEAKNKNENYL